MSGPFLLTALVATLVASGEPQATTGASPLSTQPAEESQHATASSGRRALVEEMFATLAARRDAQASTAPASARIAVSAYVYDADGNVPSMAVTNRTGAFTLYVYARRSLCQLAAASEEIPTEAEFGWRVSVRPLDAPTIGISSPAATGVARVLRSIDVQVDWQRMWDIGKSISGPSGSSRLTLRSGDRIPLDSISSSTAPNGCTGTAMTLYVGPSEGGLSGGGAARSGGARIGDDRLVSPAAGTGQTSARTGGSAGTGSGSGRGGGFSGTGSGSSGARGGGFSGRTGDSTGRGVSPPCDPDVPVTGNSLRYIEKGVGCVVATSDLDQSTLETVNTDVWFVHTLPGGTEEVQFQRVSTAPMGGRFTFPAVLLETGQRSVSLEVSGFLQAQRLPGGKENLEVKIVRILRNAGTGRANGFGSTGKTIPMPVNNEVVSFEIPLESLYPESGGHRFSLRVRVAR